MTLSHRPSKHLTQPLFWLLLFLSANTERYPDVCSVSLCSCPPGKDQTVIYKSTVVNCQGWSLSCYPPLCIKKKHAFLFDVLAPQCCWVWCPQLFFAFIPCQSNCHQSRVCINESSPVCMKRFCHSGRTLSTTNITLKNRVQMLMLVFLTYVYRMTREAQGVFMVCRVLGQLFIQLELAFLIPRIYQFLAHRVYCGGWRWAQCYLIRKKKYIGKVRFLKVIPWWHHFF